MILHAEEENMESREDGRETWYGENSSWRTNRGKIRRIFPSVAPLFQQPLKDTWDASQTKLHPRIFGSQAVCEPEGL